MGRQRNDQLPSNCSSSFEGRECFLPTPSRDGAHLAFTRFPRERDTSETHPLPRTSSVWSLEVSEGRMDENTEPRPDPPRQEKLDEDEPAPQDPPAGGTRVGDVDPPRPAKDKLSRLKRAIRGLKKFMKSKSVSTL